MGSLGSKDATTKISEFISKANKDIIPAEAVDVAKKALIDYFGVTIAGSREPSAKILSDYIKSTESKKESTVFCKGFEASAEMAALANGTAGHALDFDDTIPASVHYNLHPSVGIIPAVLALGEKYNLSGLEVLSSYIVGIEVQYRVGLAIGQRIAPSGWHSTPILGCIGSVAASANLLNLNTEQTQMALGIAGSLTGGMVRNLDTMTKTMHAGNAARNGVIAAELAKKGFGANATILDGDFNFCTMFSGSEIDGLGNLADNLLEQWDIVTRGLLFKPWPCCRATHGCVEAALNLRRNPDIILEEIDKILCKTHPVIPIFASRHTPNTGYEAKFSVEYCLYTALSSGKVVLEDFMDEKVQSGMHREIGSKVSFEHPPGWGVGTVDPKVEVTIFLKNGQRFADTVILPKGEPENPMSDEEMLAKYKNCAGMVLNDEDSEKVVGLIMDLDKVDDVKTLTNMVTGK